MELILKDMQELNINWHELTINLNDLFSDLQFKHQKEFYLFLWILILFVRNYDPELIFIVIYINPNNIQFMQFDLKSIFAFARRPSA